MSTLDQLTLTGIAHRCAQETERYFQRQKHDPRYCYELFRRAIVEREEACWDLIYHRYRPLVIHWVRRHPLFPTCSEEDEFFVNRAFEKMWAALTPEKFDRKADLPGVLEYLHMCANSAIIDHVRSSHRAQLVAIEEVPEKETADHSFEDQVMGDIHAEEIWRSVVSRLHGEQEEKVAYASFVLELKPREILELHPNTFQGVDEIYAIKQNVMARLRRDAELEALLQTND